MFAFSWVALAAYNWVPLLLHDYYGPHYIHSGFHRYKAKDVVEVVFDAIEPPLLLLLPLIIVWAARWLIKGFRKDTPPVDNAEA